MRNKIKKQIHKPKNQVKQEEISKITQIPGNYLTPSTNDHHKANIQSNTNHNSQSNTQNTKTKKTHTQAIKSKINHKIRKLRSTTNQENYQSYSKLSENRIKHTQTSNNRKLPNHQITQTQTPKSKQIKLTR